MSNSPLNRHIPEKYKQGMNNITFLSSLSMRLTAISDEKQLSILISTLLKEQLNFNNFSLFNRNTEKNAYEIYLTDLEQAEPATGLPDMLIQPDDYFWGEVLNSKFISVVEIEKIMEDERCASYFKHQDLTGIKEAVVMPLHCGNEIVGALFLWIKAVKVFQDQHNDFLEAISNLMSCCVRNLLTIKKTKQAEYEKEIILSLINTIFAVEDKESLLTIVKDKLKLLLPFNDILITRADHSKDYQYNYLYNFEDRRKLHPDFTQLIGAKYHVSDVFIADIINSDGPVVRSIDQLIDKEKAQPYLKFYAHTGIEEIVGVMMPNGKDDTSILLLTSEVKGAFKKNHLELIKGISGYLGIAITNEENIGKEQEKSILLAISTEMASVRKKSDLQRILNERFKALIPYSHIFTGKIGEDEKWMTSFILDPNSVSKHHPGYYEIINAAIRVNDGILDLAFFACTPVIFNLGELVKRPDIPFCLKMNYEYGMQEIVVVGLRYGKRKIGALIIFMEETNQINANHLKFIQGISAQLSTAMANILAYEKIEQQVIEISNFKQQLEVENLYLQEEISTTHNYSEIIGTSNAMKKVFQLVSQVAETQSTVLLLGETGTGKELIARAIHNTSLRKNKLMVKVNCAALPPNLIESELFGHERGSFTGATDRRIGKFELANNSTLFLDEIGELPLDLQVKLLRALQEKEIERVGGRAVIKTDVRIIAATNRDLQKEVLLGNFRSDLFFRLNVFPITIPPLRERKEDIPTLAAHFLFKHAKKGGKKVIGFSTRVIKELTAYDWPGNVRELEHLVERSILLTSQPMINQVNLPNAEKDDEETLLPNSQIKTIDEIEREHIMFVLRTCNGKVAGIGGAAEVLKIPSTTLNSKIKRLGIVKEYIAE